MDDILDKLFNFFDITVKHKHDLTTNERLLIWCDYVQRRIPIKKYDILLSDELSLKIKSGFFSNQAEQINQFMSQIEDGLDLNRLQSKSLLEHNTRLKVENRTDGFFVMYGVHHLHVSSIPNQQSPYFSGRSDDLCFIKFIDNYALVLDICKHKQMKSSAWSDVTFYTILKNNWPELTKPLNDIQPEQLSTDEIHHLRTGCGAANATISMNGQSYLPYSLFSVTGHNVMSVRRSIMIKKSIEANEIQPTEMSNKLYDLLLPADKFSDLRIVFST